ADVVVVAAGDHGPEARDARGPPRSAGARDRRRDGLQRGAAGPPRQRGGHGRLRRRRRRHLRRSPPGSGDRRRPGTRRGRRRRPGLAAGGAVRRGHRHSKQRGRAPGVVRPAATRRHAGRPPAAQHRRLLAAGGGRLPQGRQRLRVDGRHRRRLHGPAPGAGRRPPGGGPPDPPRRRRGRRPRRDRVLLEIAGPALAGLDRSDRQRLITTALGFGRTRDLPLRGASPHALMTWVALALPEQRQVEVSRGGPRSTTARQALGVVDVADGSLALLVPAAGLGGGVRLVAHGGRGAERAVLAAVERWHLAGRPGIAEARFTIRYGAVRPHGWYSARRGDQWLALDWVAARRRGPAAAGAGPGPVAAARGDAAR